MNDDMLSPQSLSIEPLRRNRIAAVSSAMQRRPIVLVLGMHRSGTSLCSHILSALGVDMADDIGVNLGNDRGHWERWEIVEFHDRILTLFNRDYGGRFHDFALPVAWWADPRVAQIRHEIVGFLEQRMADGYFGFKDPRTVRLMPVWHQIFNELKLAPRIVLCLRNPVQIARSLHARENLDPANGEYRWLVHMIDFFRYSSKYDFCTIEYEEWFRDPAVNIEKLQGFLDLPWQQSEADLGLVLSGIVDPALRHDGPDHREATLPLVRTLYKLVRDPDRDEARDKIGYIVSQFIGFQQLQSPFQRVLEDVAETAAKFPEVQREAAALRTLVSERDAGIASAEARASAAEARLAAALAENEAQQAQLADSAGERDAGIASAEARASAAEARLAAALAENEAQQAQLADSAGERDGRAEIERELNELKVTLAEREKVLAEHSRRAEELGVALQAEQAQVATCEAALRIAKLKTQEGNAAMESEIAALRESLAQAERKTQERAAASTTLQAEVRTLRERLAEAERKTQERAAASTTLQAEVRTLRERLAEAERETQERRAALGTMRAEIATLQDTLSAARQVGKAAIAAFRVETAAPTKSDSTGGWRRSMMRLFGARTSF
jgi:hypothetical protein